MLSTRILPHTVVRVYIRYFGQSRTMVRVCASGSKISTSTVILNTHNKIPLHILYLIPYLVHTACWKDCHDLYWTTKQMKGNLFHVNYNNYPTIKCTAKGTPKFPQMVTPTCQMQKCDRMHTCCHEACCLSTTLGVSIAGSEKA